MSMRDWVLVNEVGWGVPHDVVAFVAAIAVAVRWLGLRVARRDPSPDVGLDTSDTATRRARGTPSKR